MGLPSTGLTAGRTRPSACQAEFQRLRARSSRKASGATVRQRCHASGQDVPDLRVRVGAMGLLRSRCTVGGGESASRGDRYRPSRRASTSFAVSVGVLPTLTPTASSASFFARAVPDEPDTIAPAWPMVLPSGAVNPAM
ncbi:hypothetical protein SPURM210S_08343 [Streptomyces purpurascens]